MSASEQELSSHLMAQENQRSITKNVSNYLPFGSDNLLHVPDLSLLSFLVIQSSPDLTSRHFVVIFVSAICIREETVRCTDHHALGDDRAAAYLIAVSVDAHMPRNYGNDCVYV